MLYEIFASKMILTGFNILGSKLRYGDVIPYFDIEFELNLLSSIEILKISIYNFNLILLEM